MASLRKAVISGYLIIGTYLTMLARLPQVLRFDTILDESAHSRAQVHIVAQSKLQACTHVPSTCDIVVTTLFTLVPIITTFGLNLFINTTNPGPRARPSSYLEGMQPSAKKQIDGQNCQTPDEPITNVW